jgi:acetyl esterase/lipase
LKTSYAFARWRGAIGRTLAAGGALVAVVTMITTGPAQAATTPSVNTGTPGSVCQPTAGQYTYRPLEAGTATGWLRGAPSYYETGNPTGQFAGRPPKGIAIIIHGGGWYLVGKELVVADRPEADIWRSFGWATLNVDYTGCSTKALSDIEWFFDTVHRAWPSIPVCADGDSAGGELALMLASQRPLSCVLSRGGPTDLPALQTGLAFDPFDGLYDQNYGPAWVYNLAVAAFGVNNLAAMSPVSHASQITARVLQAPASTDPFIPRTQQSRLDLLLTAAPSHQTYVIQGPGAIQWVHGTVARFSMWGYWQDFWVMDPVH